HGLETVHVGHEDVDDSDVESMGLDRLSARVAALGQNDRVSLSFQDAFHHQSDHVVVVDDQNSCHAKPPMAARRIQTQLRTSPYARISTTKCIANVQSCQAMQHGLYRDDAMRLHNSSREYLFAIAR